MAPERHTEPGELGQASGDERSLGVHAVTESVGNPGGDGDDVLHRSPDLTADDVIAGVDAQGVAGEERLNGERPLVLREGDARGRWLADHHLPGQVGTAENADRTRGMINEHFREHLCHPPAGPELDALGDADHSRPNR